ncbi:glycosyltransferase family 4 protein [Leptolyngbya sp. FACHB-261]|nr:glycosyltransferase family 4 protein [Leptolyngbya sp. FACHB-261]
MRHQLSSQRFLKGAVFSLYQLAKISQKLGSVSSSRSLHSVAHISSTYFSDYSQIGGGERYVTSLAEAMANYVDTVLISFGPTRKSLKQGKLRLEVYPASGAVTNPTSYGFLQELINVDLVHCHQYRKSVTNLAIATSAALRKPVFVTDHGGGGSKISDAIPLSKLLNGFLLVSDFSAKSLPSTKTSKVIYGGVSNKFIAEETYREKDKRILFVGRLLPHKGVNYLIEAIDENVQLDIVGRAYDEQYFALLQELSKGKKVKFVTSANDSEIVETYQGALVTILPSVYVDVNSNQHVAPELLGLVLLESMACGTPVICTDVGGMPEIVEDGVTGFVVPPNDPTALRERINWLVNNPEAALQMGQRARERVIEKFTWDSVAKRCLEAYRQSA